MSTNAFNKTLQTAYPAVVYLAILASAGMTIVQASSDGGDRFFSADKRDPFKRSIASTSQPACSKQDPINFSDRARACPDDSQTQASNDLN